MSTYHVGDKQVVFGSLDDRMYWQVDDQALHKFMDVILMPETLGQKRSADERSGTAIAVLASPRAWANQSLAQPVVRQRHQDSGFLGVFWAWPPKRKT